jgi:hypothetical protein
MAATRELGTWIARLVGRKHETHLAKVKMPQ